MANQIKKKFIDGAIFTEIQGNIDTGVQSAKDYADTQDAAKLLEAKQYADGIKNDLLNGAGSAYDTLKELGDLLVQDGNAISALTTSIGAVDGKVDQEIIDRAVAVQDAKDYADSQDALKLQAAKDYADTQDDAKLVEAKAYTDTQIAAIPAVDLSGVVKKDGSSGAMTAALNMGGFKIENVADGEASANAVNKGQLDAGVLEAKNYADTQIAAIPAFDASALQAADVALDGRLDVLEGSGEGSVAKALVDAKAYTDAQIAAIPLVDLSGFEAADVALDGRLDVLEPKVSTLEGEMDAAQAELVSLDGRLDVVEPKVTTLEGKVSTLEALSFVKEKIVVGATLTHVDLGHEAKANSCIVFVDRLALHQDEDFTVSVVSGKTRLTWAGEFAVGGTEAVETGYPIYVTYYK